MRYEAERAFAQYDQADPNNRLVADVLEQRWNAKLEDQHRLERELDELSEATPALGADDALAIRALGEHFVSVWNDAQCPMTLKKRIARTLIKEIMVDLDESAQELHMVVHWHGGCHTAFNMPKPLSGGVAHKTALEDVELIIKMARRYRDDQIARVLSVFVTEDYQSNGEDRTSYTRVGAAFPHKKGCGFNIEITDGISVSGQLVALPPRPREES